jgi:hypothetical protein
MLSNAWPAWPQPALLFKECIPSSDSRPLGHYPRAAAGVAATPGSSSATDAETAVPDELQEEIKAQHKAALQVGKDGDVLGALHLLSEVGRRILCVRRHVFRFFSATCSESVPQRATAGRPVCWQRPHTDVAGDLGGEAPQSRSCTAVLSGSCGCRGARPRSHRGEDPPGFAWLIGLPVAAAVPSPASTQAHLGHGCPLAHAVAAWSSQCGAHVRVRSGSRSCFSLPCGGWWALI